MKLYVPSGYDAHTPLPLVILLHGIGSSGQAVEDYMQFIPLAEQHRFLYCYPDGTFESRGYPWWNYLGFTAKQAAATGWTDVDDIGFLRNLIAEVDSRFTLDHKRIYMVGHSNGSCMNYWLAGVAADLIAGMACLAGTAALDHGYQQPSEPVNILHIHGTADKYWGEALTMASFLCNTPAYVGALRHVQKWAEYNGARDPVTDLVPTLDLDLSITGLDTVVTRYMSHPPGGAVELWTINGGGHRPTLSSGGLQSEFSSLVIDWLLAHPKP